MSWTGTPGPGRRASLDTIYESEDGGPFAAFLTKTTLTSTTFTGQSGHTYGFYSVATDNLGDVQPTPTAPRPRSPSLIPLPRLLLPRQHQPPRRLRR